MDFAWSEYAQTQSITTYPLQNSDLHHREIPVFQTGPLAPLAAWAYAAMISEHYRGDETKWI